MEYFDQNMSGDLWSRLTNDVNEAKRAITASSMALYHVVAITGGVVILFVISWVIDQSHCHS